MTLPPLIKPSVYVEITSATLTGPDEGLTLSAACTAWGANYPTDGICDSTTIEIRPLPALPSTWRAVLVAAIEAHFNPTYTILYLMFPGVSAVAP